MSDQVKLSAKLAGDEDLNGLDSLAEELIKDPQTVRAAVIYFDVDKITIHPDDQSEVPTVRIRRFEPIGNVEDVSEQLRNLVQEAVEDRTGKKPLPFGIVDDVEVE